MLSRMYRWSVPDSSVVVARCVAQCPAPGSEALCAPGDIVLNHCVVWYGWYGCFCVSVNLLVICIYIYMYI